MFGRVFNRAVTSVGRAIREIFRAAPTSRPRVQNANVPTVVRSRLLPTCRLNYKKFFFSKWVQDASKTARFKFSPMHRMAANKRNQTSLLLTFIGLTYVGESEQTSKSKICSAKEQQSILQRILIDKAESIPKKSVNYAGMKFKDFEVGKRLGKPSCNSAVYAAKAKVNGDQCALKMLFNYHTNSQSLSLKKAFSKELAVLSEHGENHNTKDSSRYKKLPSHFNVIEIFSHFVDDHPKLPDAVDSYPAALPCRLHPGGYGRNRTMFYTMPIFSGTLQDYLEKNKANLLSKTSLKLLTQLMEGLYHLKKNEIAHRDLKSDNILINESRDEMPRLVITDFGDCFAEKEFGLQMPYETQETCKGGNAELMAPEVIYTECGRGNIIDYSKSDEWAAAAIAYEIFGQENPFRNQTVNRETYENSDLPELKRAPEAVQILVKQLLQRRPNDRPDITLAATVCQVLLWAPHLVENKQSNLFHQVERWFQEQTWNLTLEIWKYEIKPDIPVEKQVLLSFLCRTSVNEITEAITWLRSLIYDAFSANVLSV